jgi:hypothetical protein
MTIEELRESFKPKQVKLLFVGESPPTSGKFFYDKSSMTTITARAFELSHGFKFKGTAEFLCHFKEVGCYLEDLTHVPVDKLQRQEREDFLQAGVLPLSACIKEMQPIAVVVVLKKIEKYVRDAIMGSGLTPEVHVLPFPGNGHQNRYVEELETIIVAHLL